MRPSRRTRMRYQIDKSMAAGPVALIAWLALLSLIIIVAVALLLVLTGIAPEGGERLGFVDGLWAALMRSMDAGTLGGDNGWSFRLVMLVVTFAGIFIFSALIGVLNTGLENKLDRLRKGRSKVLESDHTIIFNWSASIFDVIKELVIANESRHKPRIVVMSDRDKVEMEDEIAGKVGDLKNTRVICRSGEPTDLFDIGIVNAEAARSIIVLSPEGDDPDSQVIKTVLALVNDPDRSGKALNIAAEIRDPASAEIARAVGGNEVQLVLADDLISRIAVQSTRQPGLSAVFTELLDFDGGEIYVVEQPELAGKTFGEAVLSYDVSTLIGLCDADGQIALNPSADHVIAPDTKAIIIAEDDSLIAIRERPSPEWANSTNLLPPPSPKAERTLLIGWNHRAPMIALELSRYVGPGSLLTVAADIPELDEAVAGLKLTNGNLAIEAVKVDGSRRAMLTGLDPASYDQILVLGYSDHMAPQPADTRTLVTLLHLRQLAEAAGISLNVVSEMIDVRNRELARVTRVEDFVVSNRMVSLMLAQASENPYLEAIFQDLLNEEGVEICMRPLRDYASPGEGKTFFEIAETALRRGEVAIGHHRHALQDASGRGLGGVVINPARSAVTHYDADDRIIVLARG